MPNKILILNNRKNKIKNTENKCGSDIWHKKPYFIYILVYLPDVARVKSIIKYDQKFACMVSTNKI